MRIKNSVTVKKNSFVNQAEYEAQEKQHVYLVEVAVLMPETTSFDQATGKQIRTQESGGTSVNFLFHSYPTIDSITLAANNHPILSRTERYSMFRALMITGLKSWGIPQLPNNPVFGAELVYMRTDWKANAILEDGSSLIGECFGYVSITKKEIL